MHKSTGRILVIDDDVFFANYAANLLTDLGGYSVMQSHSADEGLGLACKLKFPLVIVNLKMPLRQCFDNVDTSKAGKTGLVLAREIRKASPSTRVIIQSGAADADLERIPFQTDNVGFLRKSANSSELFGAVQKILDPNATRAKSFIVR